MFTENYRLLHRLYIATYGDHIYVLYQFNRLEC